MKNKKRQMELVTLTEFPMLMREIGLAPALEIVCGAFVAEQIRKKFITHVFGRQIRKATCSLEAQYGQTEWEREHPCIAAAYHALAEAGV